MNLIKTLTFVFLFLIASTFLSLIRMPESFKGGVWPEVKRIMFIQQDEIFRVQSAMNDFKSEIRKELDAVEADVYKKNPSAKPDYNRKFYNDRFLLKQYYLVGRDGKVYSENTGKTNDD